MLAETPPPEENLSSWTEEKQPEPAVEAVADEGNDTVAEIHKETSCQPEVGVVVFFFYNISSKRSSNKTFVCLICFTGRFLLRHLDVRWRGVVHNAQLNHRSGIP